MRLRRSHRRSASLAGVAAVFALVGSAALAQDRVGVTSAVNPATTGTPPGQTPRTLLLGTDVVFNERIQTEAGGQTELLFLDRSSFSIGPGSDLVIDEFVYDPSAGTGKLSASAVKGVFRFVGGALSKNPGAVTIKAPTATIGLRGGICIFTVGANGALSATMVYGKEMTVTAAGVTSRATRQNSIITVGGPGQTPSAPGVAPAGSTGQIVAQLDGRPGAAGGANAPPTQAQLDGSGYTQTNSGNPQGSTADARQNGASASGGGSPPPINVANFSNITDVSTVQATEGVQSSLLTFDPSLLADFLTNLTPEIDMPTTGTATYEGSAIGAVLVGSTPTSASGTFQQSWDFGRRNGSVQITNFGGANLSGSVSAPSAPNIFTGGIAGTSGSGPVSGALVGFFQTVSGVPAGQVSGAFGFTGTNITGSGTFQARPPG
jgi:hypothetical protein